MRYLLCAILLSGCGPQGDPTPLPTQAAAVQLTWKIYQDYYGSIGTPPPIYWRREHCNGSSYVCTFDDGLAGLDTDQWIEVGAPVAIPYKIGGTALMHELLHAAQANIGFSDPNHMRPEWWDSIPVQPFQIKHLAEQAVIDAGL